MPVKFDPRNKETLLSPERRKSLDMYRMLSLIPILPHHVIADIGCGPGFFTVPLAKYLWDGKIYAVDIKQEMLDAAKEGVDRERLSNVEYVKSTERRLPIKKGILDGAVAAFVIQEAAGRESLLKEIHRCMRTPGWTVILEWHRKKSKEGPPLKQRIADTDMMNLLEKTGFRVASKHDLNSQHYMIVARA